jgi:CheY-like chemotaxis protein
MTEAFKILLVDDEAEIVANLTEILEEEGYICTGAIGSAEAIANANVERFSLIISDMSMPKMTGLEMVPHIRASTHNGTTPMLILSGALTDSHLMGLEKLGIIDVMSKPPDLEILLKVIKKAVQKRARKAEKSYEPAIIKVFHDSFANTIKGHLAEKVKVSAPEVNSAAVVGVEHCGMVNFYGRRVSGVVTISFGRGFTTEFANAMLGSSLDAAGLQIFESAASEMVEQVTYAAVLAFQSDLGLHVQAMNATLLHGPMAEIPLVGELPRMKITADLNGTKCYLEFALVDMAKAFAGKTDKSDAKIAQEA